MKRFEESMRRTLATVFSIALALSMLASPVPVAAQNPAPPVGKHYIQISWTYTQGADLATGINVLEGSISGGPYVTISSPPLPVTQTTFFDIGCSGGSKCFYVLQAVDAIGISSPSSVEVSATQLTNPSAAANVSATAH